MRSRQRSRWIVLALACGLLGAPAAWADQPGQSEDIEVPPPPPTREAPAPSYSEPAPAPPPMEEPVAAGPPGFLVRTARSVVDVFRGSDFE